MKRVLDLFFSSFGLLIFSPFLISLIILIWIQDFKNPIYSSVRIGKNKKEFLMYKLRSMRINSDRSGVESTSSNDMRITEIGKIIRNLKMDELSQLINVFFGSMSLVGPRPNTLKGVSKYTQLEKKLLEMKPGITDFASIVFSDEGDILKSSNDPDLDYDKLIRPRKSLLGLFYVKNSSILIDVCLCLITVTAIFSRKKGLFLLGGLLKFLKADKSLIDIASRVEKLEPMAPPE